MPKVMEYEELKDSLPKVLDYVADTHESVTVRRVGVPSVRISPIRIYRTTEPDPELYCEIKCDLFADESSDWEDA
ncbi:MAG: hypothetical protein IJ658_06590 [Kiritimatiellae bacterium]|nr:hypothetical protein [Kiritimatiellia bacterium]